MLISRKDRMIPVALSMTLAQVFKKLTLNDFSAGSCIELNGKLFDGKQRLTDLGLSEQQVLTFSLDFGWTLPGGMKRLLSSNKISPGITAR